MRNTLAVMNAEAQNKCRSAEYARTVAQSVIQSQCVDTVTEGKQRHVWSFLSSTNSQGAVCDVCGNNCKELYRYQYLRNQPEFY